MPSFNKSPFPFCSAARKWNETRFGAQIDALRATTGIPVRPDSARSQQSNSSAGSNPRGKAKRVQVDEQANTTEQQTKGTAEQMPRSSDLVVVLFLFLFLFFVFVLFLFLRTVTCLCFCGRGPACAVVAIGPRQNGQRQRAVHVW